MCVKSNLHQIPRSYFHGSSSGPQARVTEQGDVGGALPGPQGEEILPRHACIHVVR